MMAVLVGFIAPGGLGAEPDPEQKDGSFGWILVASGRGAGLLEPERAEKGSVLIDVRRATWRRSGEDPGRKVEPVRTLEGVRLPEGVTDVQFSPQGRRVAYRVNVPGARREGKTPAKQGVRLRDLDREGEVELVAQAVVMEHSWSPDGKWLACSWDDRLVLIEGATGRKVWSLRTTDLSKDFFAHGIQQFCWRPDSGALAFRVLFLGGRMVIDGRPSSVAGDTDLFVIEVESQHRTRVQLPPAFVHDAHTSLVPVRWEREEK